MFFAAWLAVSLSPAVAAPLVFDVPRTKVVNLPADSVNPQMKRKVTCSLFQKIMIKEVDHGEKGAARLSFLPANTALESCQEEIQENETVLQDWYGYFLGVKDRWVFFSGDDGTVRGGMPFLIWDVQSNKKVFNDESVGTTFELSGNDNLRYKRVASADCSVMVSPRNCIEKLAHAAGIKSDFRTLCEKSYQDEMSKLAHWRCQEHKTPDEKCLTAELVKAKSEISSSPTIITYDVEANVNPRGTTLKALSRVSNCYPAQ